LWQTKHQLKNIEQDIFSWSTDFLI